MSHDYFVWNVIQEKGKNIQILKYGTVVHIM